MAEADYGFGDLGARLDSGHAIFFVFYLVNRNGHAPRLYNIDFYSDASEHLTLDKQYCPPI